MVSPLPPALESSLLLLVLRRRVQPPAQLAGSGWSSEQGPRTPRRRRAQRPRLGDLGWFCASAPDPDPAEAGGRHGQDEEEI